MVPVQLKFEQAKKFITLKNIVCAYTEIIADTLNYFYEYKHPLLFKECFLHEM